MKPSLELRQGLRLAMTPQLQQAIHLLQMNSLELRAELAAVQASNPLLEIDDEIISEEISTSAQTEQTETEPSAIEYIDLDDNAISDKVEAIDDYWWNAQAFASAPARMQHPESAADFDLGQQRQPAMSLRQSLQQQLLDSNLNLRDKLIAEILIEFIADSGYLARPLQQILDSTGLLDHVGLDEIEMVLHQIQNFDPAGIAARTPDECLQLQLRLLDKTHDTVQLAQLVVADYLPQLARKDFNVIKKSLGVSIQALRQAIELIQTLNPHPGYSVGDAGVEYIVPDIVVKRNNSAWLAALNPQAMPKLMINRDYHSLIKTNARNSEFKQLKEQLQNATWFLNALEKRYTTILAVANEIVRRQQSFFDHGPQAMLPLILKDIAEHLDIHESTVSRATAGKYILTPVGIYELKYFFSSQLQTSDGGSTSSLAIQSMIKKMIDDEPPGKPISDNKISTLLNHRGIKVARRTIAKYREQMNIPSSSRRKCL